MAGLSKVSYAYNGQDELMEAEETGAGGTVTTEYGHDARGLLETVKRGGSAEVGYGHRASGELEWSTVGGTRVEYEYDGQERVSAMTGPAGRFTGVWEAGGGRLLTVEGPNGYERRSPSRTGASTRWVPPSWG